MNAFGNYLRALRKENGITQQQLAERLNVSNRAVSKWEKGEAFPETGQLIPLADVFGISADELLHGRKAECAAIKSDRQTAERRTLLFYIGNTAAALCAAILLILVFFTGCNAFTDSRFPVPAVNLFYYFGDAYTGIRATTAELGDYYLANRSLIDVPLYTNAACGTLFSATVLVTVPLFAAITLVRYVDLLLNASEKSLTKPVVACFVAYAFGCALLLALNNVRFNESAGAERTVSGLSLNGPAAAGLICGAACLAVYIVCAVLKNRSRFCFDTAVKYAFSAANIVLLCVSLGYLASPMLGFSNVSLRNGKQTSVSLFSLLRIFALHRFPEFWERGSMEGLYFGELSDVPYDAVDILLTSLLFYVPLFFLTAVRLMLYAFNLCDGKHRRPILLEALCFALTVPFAMYAIVPPYAYAKYCMLLPRFHGLIVLCIVSGVQFLVSAAHFAVTYLLMKKQVKGKEES